MKIIISYYGADDLDSNYNSISGKQKTFIIEGNSKEELNDKTIAKLNNIIERKGFIVDVKAENLS